MPTVYAVLRSGYDTLIITPAPRAAPMPTETLSPRVASGSLAYVILLTAVAALGGLLFGYDTAVISGAIGFLKERFQLGEWFEGIAASSVLAGCMLGAAGAGTLSDRFGRRRLLLVSAVLFTVSAIWAAVPQVLAEFIAARFLGGLGIGIASMLSPLYIAEVAPARIRGRLVSVNQLAIVTGMLIVYWVNAWIAGSGDQAWNVAQGWRWMFASGVLPAVLFFGLLFAVPESPRWLTSRGRDDEALAVLTRVGGSEAAARQMDEIRRTLAMETASVGQLFQPGVRMALFIAVVLAVLQQVTGINVVLYYAPKIFQSAQMTGSAINDTVVVGAVNLIFTVLAIWIVDRIGRKQLLLAASLGMAISLAMLGHSFYRIEQAAAQQATVSYGREVLWYTLAYVASFAVAMGPVVWVVMSEIFPTRTRGLAMSIATVCLWAACLLVSTTFPWMLKHLRGSITFWFYGGMCVVALVFVACFVPETKGKTLEEIERSWLR